MDNDTRPTGPALAERLGGVFDFSAGSVRFPARDYTVRCSITGRVHLVVRGGRAVALGRISEGPDVLAVEFADALRNEGLTGPSESLGAWVRRGFEGQPS